MPITSPIFCYTFCVRCQPVSHEWIGKELGLTPPYAPLRVTHSPAHPLLAEGSGISGCLTIFPNTINVL